MAIEGDTIGYTDESSALSFKSAPFHPSFKKRQGKIVEGEEPPESDEMGVSFLQAYVIDYLNKKSRSYDELKDPKLLNERIVPIENMDKVFNLEYNEGSPEVNIFEVKITLEGGKLEKAELVSRVLDAGNADYRDPDDEDTFSLNSSEGPFFVPVCEIVNLTVTRVWMRDNIHWWGDLLTNRCDPWVPIYEDKNTNPEAPPQWEYTASIGSINGKLLIPQAPVQITPAEYDQLRYIILEVTISVSRVTEIIYKIESTAASVDVDPAEKNALPDKIEINIGTTQKGKSCILYKGNITLESYEAYSEPKGISNVALGLDNYDRYYKYKIS